MIDGFLRAHATVFRGQFSGDRGHERWSVNGIADTSDPPYNVTCPCPRGSIGLKDDSGNGNLLSLTDFC